MRAASRDLLASLIVKMSLKRALCAGLNITESRREIIITNMGFRVIVVTYIIIVRKSNRSFGFKAITIHPRHIVFCN